MVEFKKRICILFYLLLAFAGHGQDQTVGVFLNDSTAINGYTLFSPVSDFNTYLVDNCGRKLNSWQFSTVPGMMAYLLPNGNLARAGRLFNNFGAGGSGGLIEIRSWNDDPVWQFRYSNENVKQHHDFEVLDNGNVLLIAWERRPVTDIVSAGRVPESIGANGVWMEQIVEVKPIGQDSGEIVWSWHLYDHLVQDQYPMLANYGEISNHPERLDINYRAFSEQNPDSPGAADWIHLNSIDYNPEQDLIVISSRNTSEIYIIDHSTTTEEAAGSAGGRFGMGGDFLFRFGNDVVHDSDGNHEQQLFSQHDASWIQRNGHYTGEISIFNNGLGRDLENTSSVEIIKPRFDESGFKFDSLTGSYFVDMRTSIFPEEDFPFSSARISGVQVLEGDHIQITSGNTGTVYELDADRKLVWKFVNPVSQIGPVPQGSNPFLNDIFRALRYEPDYPAFQDRDLTANEFLELEAIDYGCEVYPAISSSVEEAFTEDVLFFPNPFTSELRLDNPEYISDLHLYDQMGRQKNLSSDFLNGRLSLDYLQPGLYFLYYKWKGRQKYQKLVKR